MAAYRITVQSAEISGRSFVAFACDVEREEAGDWVTVATGVVVRLELPAVTGCADAAELRALLVARAREMAEVRRQGLWESIASRLPELPVTIEIGEV